jgi:arylsulfatase A-like enzyme
MKNVVLMTLDACRKDVFGCYGKAQGLTPFFDSLKDKSIVFTKAQATGPYTQASFPAILTSSYYMEYGWQQRCPSQRIFVSEILKRKGIATAAFHSNPYLCAYFGWNRGWDLFMDSMKEKVTPMVPFLKGDQINKKAEAWLSAWRARESQKPFFLWLHYMDIHEPYVPAPEYLNFVDPALDLSQEDMFSLFKEVLLKRDISDPDKVALLKKLYHAHVREVDCYARDFFGILESLGLLESTTLIITSDHGDEFNEHGGLSHDDKLYSELIDVPLLIYDADRKKGEECPHLVSNIDIPSTIVHLFGFNPVDAFKGRSLLPMESYTSKGCFGEALFQIKGKGGDPKRDVYYFREGDLKISYRADRDSWEMYDLNVDPQELDNIVEGHAKAEAFKAKLRPRVRRWENPA